MSLERIVREPAREVPVFGTCDVLVIGGGPAGCAAAASAASLGADTLLVERYGYLGGMSTGGFVLWIDRMSDWQGRRVIAGFARELLDRMPPGTVLGAPAEAWGSRDPSMVSYWRQRHAAYHDTVTWSPTLDPEMLKIVSNDLLLEKGVRLLFHAWVAAPVREEQEIKGVIFESKSGRMAVLARVVIDATGDGDLFPGAGVPFETEFVSGNTHSTLNVAFRVGGVDFERYGRFRYENPDEYDAMMAGGAEMGLHERPWRLPRNDVAFFMGPRLHGYDCLKVEDLTRVELESRRLILELLAFYRGNMPGFEDAWLMDTAPQIGVRHSRRLLGTKRVTRSEWVEGKRHEDEIGVCPAPTPEHPNVSIPLGCLVPTAADNLLAAGRNLSCDPVSHTFLREVPVCWVMGQAAGVAAAVAVASGVKVRDVDVRRVQGELIRQGTYLGTTSQVSGREA